MLRKLELQNCLLATAAAQEMKISIKDFFSKCDQILFTEEILKGKLHFLCNAILMIQKD